MRVKAMPSKNPIDSGARTGVSAPHLLELGFTGQPGAADPTQSLGNSDIGNSGLELRVGLRSLYRQAD